MQRTSRHARPVKGSILRGRLLLTVVLVLAPVGAAHAYVDPNAAGPLFQLLFPLLVAISSLIVGLRHRVAQLWRRLLGTHDRTSLPVEKQRADAEGQ
jgi:hypothetical protein